jgi:hypothetical protein
MPQHDQVAPALLLRVVRGDPTEDELAALITVLLAIAAGSAAAPAPASARPATEARWTRHSPRYRGPGAWQRRDR